MKRGVVFSVIVCGLLITSLVAAAMVDAHSSRNGGSEIEGLVSTTVPVAGARSAGRTEQGRPATNAAPSQRQPHEAGAGGRTQAAAAATGTNAATGANAATGTNGTKAADDTHGAQTAGHDNVAAAETPHPLDPALELAREALARIEAEIEDYTATMVKRERISGRLGGETKIDLKVRTRRVEDGKLVRPLSAYLLFQNPWLARGREVIWVEGRNEGKLIAHEGGIKNIIRVSLAPDDQLAMLGNKYSITEIGLTRLVEKLIEKGERDREVGAVDVDISDGHKVGDRPCRLIQVTHPDPDPRFDFHIAQIFLDTERMIPLRYAAFMWPEKPDGPPLLEEEYTYLNVRLNVGLTDADFDPDNPAYQFP
jgi:hypothetical protein